MADGSLFGRIQPRIVDLFAGIGGTSTGVGTLDEAAAWLVGVARG